MQDGTYFPALASSVWLVGGLLAVELLHFKWQVAHIEKNASKLSEEENKQRVQRIFDRFDIDGDGVELEEVFQIVAAIDPTIESDRVVALFNEADTDDGGSIDFAEFYHAVTKAPDPTKKKKKGHKKLDLAILVKKQQRAETKAAASGRMFLLCFLLYPGYVKGSPVISQRDWVRLKQTHGESWVFRLTSKIFEVFAVRLFPQPSAWVAIAFICSYLLRSQCRDLGHGQKLLLVDYSVNCNSDEVGTACGRSVAPLALLICVSVG